MIYSKISRVLALVAVSFVLTGLGHSAQTKQISTKKPPHRELKDKDLTILDLTIEKHSLQDVQAKLGPAEIIETGDASEFSAFACYVSQESSDGTKVIFESGEIQGGTTLGSFRLLAGTEQFKWSNKCFKSPRVSKDVATQSDLKLGMSQAAFTAIFGQPKRVDKQMLYVFSSRRRMTPEEKRKAEEIFNMKYADADAFWDITSAMRARFSKSGLSDLMISQTTSN